MRYKNVLLEAEGRTAFFLRPRSPLSLGESGGTVGGMTRLPSPTPVPGPALSRDDLVSILTGVASGEYRTSDLLPRANAWLEARGRNPVTAKTLGEEIARRLKLERRHVHGHLVAWRVTPEAVAGRDWFVEPGSS